MQLPCLAHSCASSDGVGVMHKLRRISSAEGAGVSAHHCGAGPERASGHNPWSTKPNRPLRPEHCIEPRSPRQYSGDQLAASV